jgi:amino acid transporter
MQPSPRRPDAGPALPRELGFRDLTLFALLGVSGTRGAALAAQTGFSSIALWAAAAVFFFIPSAFAIARLSARFPDEGGLYIWTRQCFGEWHGFLCFWVYWLSIAFFFPSALMASSSMAAYAFGPAHVHLANEKSYVFTASIIALAVITAVNLIGLKFGKWLDNAGAVATYLVCAAMAVTAAIVWTHRGSATPLQLAPKLRWSEATFFTQMVYALTGLELAPILGGEIKNPETSLPRASLAVAPLAAAYYMLSTTSLLVILPASDVSPLNGIAQSAFAAGRLVGWSSIAPLTAALLTLGAVGQLAVIGAATSRLPYALGVDGLLPPALSRLHPRWRTPHVSILLFGALAAGVLALAQLGDTLGGAFQVLLDAMAISGLGPFLYIFAAAWKCGARWSAASGLTVTAVAILMSLAPTADAASIWLFESKVLGLAACLVISARILYSRGRRTH